MLLFSIPRRLAWSRRTSALKTVHFSGSRFSNSFHKLRFKPILGPQPPSCPFGLVMWRAGRRLWPWLCSWPHPHQAGPLRLERTHRLLSFPPPPGLSLPAVLWSFWKHPTCSHNDHPATSWDGCHSWLLSPHSVDGETETRHSGQGWFTAGELPCGRATGRLPGAQDVTQNLLGGFC